MIDPDVSGQSQPLVATPINFSCHHAFLAMTPFTLLRVTVDTINTLAKSKLRRIYLVYTSISKVWWLE